MRIYPEIEMESLYDQAVARYLDKMDWNISDWLEPHEWKLYRQYYKEIHGYEIDE